MIQEKGSISVHTENIFPIIKKWLYSDKDIFLRELVSNGCDAIMKLKRLSAIGEAKVEENPKYEIRVILDKNKKTIQVIDNGIGMTADEVKKYINQVAFSSAQEFIEKYKDKAGEENQIIGHFGLGFYSAFMVADKVEIDTLSYQEGAEAVQWISEGGTEYELKPSKRTQRGTTVTLHISDDSREFLDSYKLRDIINKYCYFLPVEIYFEDANEKEEKIKKGEKLEEPKPLNDTNPLWLKAPNQCTEEEYKEFYRKVFNDFREPLFWIHLNVDYPFRLKGILYFPKLKNQFDTLEGQIKLYCNQVFVADNIKEVIPEFLMLLKGTIDCPELPLNVSRSFLQNDKYVQKISDHISKKVADKLTSLFKTERENYNKYWDDISPFIKFGCMKDNKFYERVKDIIIYKTTNDEYVTLKDYLERNKDKHENEVFYVNDEKQQAQYIKMFKENGLEAVYLDDMIDNHFMSFIELKQSPVRFKRVDADISKSLKDNTAKIDDKEDNKIRKTLEDIFKDSLNKDDVKIQVESLKASEIPAIILLSEDSRRMEEIVSRFGNMGINNPFPKEQTLIINKNNDLVKALLELKDDKEKENDIKLICQHIYDLAMLSHRPMEPEEMTDFIKRSNKILLRLATGEKKE
mgnify:CR=1 FL=1